MIRMSTACVTKMFTPQRVMSCPSFCLRYAARCCMQTSVRRESRVTNIQENSFNKQKCHQTSVSSTYHQDKACNRQISSDLTCSNQGKSASKVENVAYAYYKPKENFIQQLTDKNSKFQNEFVSEKWKIVCSHNRLHPELTYPNSWKHLNLNSNAFQLSEEKTFKHLLSTDKYLSRSVSTSCFRSYHTGTRSFPWLKENILLKTHQTRLEHHAELPGPRCIHQEVLPDRFDIRSNATFKQYLDSLLAEFEHSNKVLSSQTSEHNVNMKEINSRIVELTPLVSLIQELYKLTAQIKELDVLVSGLQADDTEMKQMAELEREECEQQMVQLQLQLIDLMVGHERADKNDIILEVNAGVGGQEAMLFTGEMFDLYQMYAYWRGWTFDVLSSDLAEQGGLRKASASVCGVGVYRLLKFESGVHRVQRVPKTEKAGRIHTSTMTVAVMPQPTEIEVVIHPKELRVETFKSSGKGGQHVNTTDSAVRITHLPTGMVAECQQERSQIKNKAMALKVLRSRIYEKELESQQMKYKADRKIQVGTAGRSEKIRTYNFPQDRITDHRINHSLFNLAGFMASGEPLHGLITALLKESQYSVLDDILHDFAQNRKKQSA